MKRFFIFCCGGLGREMACTVVRNNNKSCEWDEIRFVDDTPELSGTMVNGLEVWSFDEYLARGPLPEDRFVIAAGEAVTRRAIHEKLMAHNIQLGVVVHEDNYMDPSSEVGGGTMIQGQAAPGPNCKVGQCVLLQGHCILGHDVEIGDYSTISSLAFVGGDTTIGDSTYIAPGVLIRNGIQIGRNCIIGMGSVVTKSIPDNSVAYGNPCKVVRQNESGKVFTKHG